jgi:hypothetical protein
VHPDHGVLFDPGLFLGCQGNFWAALLHLFFGKGNPLVFNGIVLSRQA